MTAQLLLCAADLTAKAGFGALVHKVATLRTADDALAGRQTLPDVYPEEVYVSHRKLSEPQHPLRTGDGPVDPEYGDGAMSDGSGRRGTAATTTPLRMQAGPGGAEPTDGRADRRD